MRYLPTIGLALFAALLFGVLIAPTPSTAQVDCPALSIANLENFKDSCMETPGSSVCLGSNVSLEMAPGAMMTGRTLPLADVQVVRTLPLNTASGEAGLAQLNVPANVPLSIAETGLRYIMMGEVTLENAVDPASAFVPAAPITVATVVGSNLRSFPSTNGRIVGSASVGTEMQADGLSNDRGWFRVQFNDQTAWVSRQIVVVREGDAEALPIITDDSRTLMQDFVLQTGTEAAECATVTPSFLWIQAPGGVTANIVVNGTEIRFTDSIALQTLPGNLMQLSVLSGGASSDSLNVPAGFTMQIPLSADGRTRDGFWQGLRPITNTERSVLGVASQVPNDLLYRTMTVPSQAEVQTLLAQINRASSGQATASGTGAVSCAGFRPTSPLDTIVNGETIFFWDGIDGVDTYRVNVLDENGNRRGGGTLDAFNTTLTVNTGVTALGEAAGFAWNVEALIGGEVVCTTATLNVVRVNVQQPVANPGGGNNVGDGDGGGTGDDGGGQPAPEPTPCLWNQC